MTGRATREKAFVAYFLHFAFFDNLLTTFCINDLGFDANVIHIFSFSKMLLQKEELEQKHLHLVQIVESEKTAKFTYTQQVEDLSIEVGYFGLHFKLTQDV